MLIRELHVIYTQVIRLLRVDGVVGVPSLSASGNTTRRSPKNSGVSSGVRMHDSSDSDTDEDEAVSECGSDSASS